MMNLLSPMVAKVALVLTVELFGRCNFAERKVRETPTDLRHDASTSSGVPHASRTTALAVGSSGLRRD